MFVRVMSCSRHTYWYSNHVGCTFEVSDKPQIHPRGKSYRLIPGAFNEMRYPKLKEEHGISALGLNIDDAIEVEVKQDNISAVHLLKRGEAIEY